MAHIRIRPNGRIQFDLHVYGQRFREGTKLEATPKNLKQAHAKLAKINAEITLGTFQYRQHFPHSKKVALYEALERKQRPDHRFPFFDEYANEWFDRQQAKWKSSYKQTVWLNLTSHGKIMNIPVNKGSSEPSKDTQNPSHTSLLCLMLAFKVVSLFSMFKHICL
ncbi:Arm DNA-binding domain-containing protein, partial [Vibrio diabolicus]|uniref:Arm DNA-binding domain-containing protein n=1 Tax=Vibrio diabolicus TaxID=50719 RepID=UPI00293FB1AD